MAKDYGVRAGQVRKSFLSDVIVFERYVSESGRYGGYRWCSGEHSYTIELVSEKELAAMPLAGQWVPKPGRTEDHTRMRIARASADDAERWGLT